MHSMGIHLGGLRSVVGTKKVFWYFGNDLECHYKNRPALGWKRSPSTKCNNVTRNERCFESVWGVPFELSPSGIIQLCPHPKFEHTA